MRVFLFAAAVALLCVGMAAPDVNAGSEAFTVALIPDTQYYCSLYPNPDLPADLGRPEMYYTLTDWLKNNTAEKNIKFAIHLGDIVQNPGIQSEWVIADAAQKKLETDSGPWTLPYSVLPGNHDLKDSGGYGTYYSNYDNYFGSSRFAGQSFYGGADTANNHNNYCFFEGGGLQFMVLSIEWNPSAATLAWANQIVANHPNHRIIVATHSYLEDTVAEDRTSDGGDQIWEGLINVEGNDNIFMVVSGHISGWNHRDVTTDYGNTVTEILTDYQWEPHGLSSEEYGGNGWLNLMKFVPDEDKIYFSTYSPYLDKSLESDWDAGLHVYTIDYEMTPEPSTAILIIAGLLAIGAWKFRWPRRKNVAA